MNSADIKTVKLLINDGDVSKKLANLEKQLEAARLQKERLEKKSVLNAKETKDLKDFSLQVASCTRQINNLRGTSQLVEKTLSSLSKATVPELKRTLKALEKEVNSGAIERGSEKWKKYQKAIQEVKTELRSVSEEQKEASKSLKTSLSEFGKSFVGVSTIVTQGLQALTGVKETVQSCVNAYAEMEEHMAQVRKYTGMSTEEVTELNESFKQMDTRTARERLNDLAGDAGRLGIQGKKDVLDFVDAADKINVALGEDLGEDGVKNIGKLAQLFGDSDKMGLKQAMLSTGSVINELAQSSSASEGYIMDFTARLAGVGKQANMTQAQVMSYASILDQSMVSCEKGATAMQNVLMALYKDPQKMAKVAGIDVKQFSETLKKDGNAALLQFVEALNKAGNMDVLAPMLKDMNISGAGVTQTISALANNIDLLKSTQEQATKAFQDGTSVTNEFNVQNNTVQAGLDKAKKRFHDVAVELGEKLQPAVKHLISGSSLLVNGLNTLINFFVQYRGELLTITLAIVGYTLAVQASNIIFRAQYAWLIICQAAQQVWNVVVNTGRTLTLLYSIAQAKLTGNLTRAAAAQKMLNVAMSSNVIGLVIAAVTILIGSFISLYHRIKETSSAQKTLAEIQSKATESAQEQIFTINALRDAAKNEALSENERLTACQKLNAISPSFCANIDKVTDKYTESTKAVQDYVDALIRQYEIEGAKDKLKEIGKQRADLIVQLRAAEKAVENDKQIEKSNSYSLSIAGNMTAGANAINALVHSRKVASIKQQLETLDNDEKYIREIYGSDIQHSVVKAPDPVHVVTGGGGGYTPTNNTPSSDSNTSSTNDDAEQKRREAARKEDIRLEAEAKDALRKMDHDFVLSGRTDYANYLKERNAMEVDYLKKRQNCWTTADDEWARYKEKIAEQDDSLAKEQNAWSLKEIDRQYEEELALAKRKHILSSKTEEEQQAELDAIELKHLDKRIEWLRKNGGTPQQVIEEGAKRDQMAKEQENQREVRQQEKMKALKEQYHNKTAQEIYDYESSLLEEMHNKGLLDEEQYQKLLLAIKKKYKGEAQKEADQLIKERKDAASSALNDAGYNDEKWQQGGNNSASGIAGALVDVGKSLNEINRAKEAYAKLKELRDNDLIDQQAYDDAKGELDKQSFDRFVAMAQAAYSAVSAMLNSYTNLMSASRDAEVAKTEASYDKQIEAAGSSSAKGKKLEEQKQAAVAKIKNRYNKRMMAVEVAQAMAQTAMNALMAYGSLVKIPVVGPALAAAAAAAATAAGLIQVAAIKKQHEAESAGYYSGGFTGGNNYRKEAGVVHEGEFVANHKAVANPNVAPMLRLIDQAQRNNTIGSLTAEDVSRALPMSAASSVSSPMATQQPIVIHENQRTAKALERLNDNIDTGITAIVAIDGPNGFDRQWKHYQKLQSHK